MRSPSSIIATIMRRSWTQHRGRLAATMATVVIGTSMATMIAAVVLSITNAIDDATGLDALDTELVVSSRAPAGLSPEIIAAAGEVAAPARTAPVLVVNTRLAAIDRGQITLLGLDPADMSTFADADGVAAAFAAGAPDDGVVVGRQWAERQGVAVGDRIRFSSAGGSTEWEVLAISEASLPNDGSIGFAAIGSLQDRFQRLGVDFLAVESGAESATLRSELASVAGPAAIVGSPGEVLAPEQSSFAFVRLIMWMMGGIGLLIAACILLISWRMMIDDQRQSIAKFRLLGGNFRSLVAGSAIVVGVLSAIGAAIGVPLGLLGARAMTEFANQVVNLTGLAAAATTPPLVIPALVGFIGSLVMAVIAFAVSMRALRRIPPIEAIRGVPEVAPTVRPSRRLAVVAVVATVGAFVLSRVIPPTLAGMPLVLVIVAAVAFAVLLPQVVGYHGGRSGGFHAMAAARELLVGGRNRAAMTSVLAVALILTIAMGGVAATLGHGLRTSVEAWTGGDLYVLPAEPGRNLRDEKFPIDTTAELEAVDGVASVVPFTLSPIKYEDRNVQLYAWGTEGVEQAVDLEVEDGVSGAELWRSLDEGSVAVSTNFAWLHDIEVGDTLAVPSHDGAYEAEVVALVNDYTGDTGVIITSFETYTAITGDSRTFDLIVMVDDGASVADVRAAITTELGDYDGLTVWTGQEMRDHLLGLLGQVLAILQMIGVFILVLAILIGLTTTAASVAARRRAIGVSRLIGATRGGISGQLTRESITSGVIAWVIAAPLGLFIATTVMADAVGSQSGTFPPVQIPWLTAGLALLGALVAGLVAVRLPSRRLLDVDVVDVLTHD